MAIQQFFSRIFYGFILMVGLFSNLKLLAQEQAHIVGDFADPSVIYADGQYFAVGTSSEWAPHLPIYKSKDLRNWDQVGFVFEKTPEWIQSSFWAPEYYYQNGTYYVYYSAKRKSDGVSCIGVATSKYPDRGFVDQGVVVDFGTESIDAFVVKEGQDLYMTWKAYGLDKRPIELLGSKLSSDGLRLEGEPFSILLDSAKIGIEGQSFVKHGGYYYMFYSAGACCGPGCDYHVQAVRSKTIEGPYEDVGEAVLLGSNEGWKCMGHGTFVEDKKGDYYYVFHGYNQDGTIYTGRLGLLARLVWSDKDTPVFEFIKNDADKSTSDLHLDFRKLSKEKFFGQWDFRNSIPKYGLSKAGLHVASGQKAGNPIGSVLTWRPANKVYAVTAKIDLGNSNHSLRKGICIYGDQDKSVGVSIEGNHLISWVQKGDQFEELSNIEIANGNKEIELKLESKQDLGVSAYYSIKKGQWLSIPISKKDLFSIRDLAPWDRSPRPGIHVSGSADQKALFKEFSLQY
ncbi:glycoside hydrolase family 43 protein [Sphingobacterium sp. WM]|uniref:glycoside hydrolase family 43 protein n=1 Tax=Sphingobacterium sp. WM TaxID=3031802 RepID=UPI00240D09C3|nr:glycoside hydrolase family 43 protein [Sphingobacterium sp. WM]WFB62193.1 glycoside hydrolase family 43 protein [Sphingobacterium sp. WM]